MLTVERDEEGETMKDGENHGRWSQEWERDEERGKHGRRRKRDREFATYLEMNERDCHQRRCIMVGHRLRLSTSSLLEVGFRFEFFSQFVFAKVFNRDSGFRDYLGFFFFKFLFMATSTPTKRTSSSWSVKSVIKARLSHTSLEKAYAFQESRFISYASRRFHPASPWGAPEKRLYKLWYQPTILWVSPGGLWKLEL